MDEKLKSPTLHNYQTQTSNLENVASSSNKAKGLQYIGAMKTDCQRNKANFHNYLLQTYISIYMYIPVPVHCF